MSLIIYIYIYQPPRSRLYKAPAVTSASHWTRASPLLDIGGIYTACPHVASQYSFLTYHGRQRCKQVYMETKIQKIKSKK